MKTQEKMNRRTFLKTMGIGAAAVSLTCLGLGAAASLPPQIEKPENEFKGENLMEPKKILIAYATKSGSTAETASFIGKQLGEQGMQVTVQPVDRVTDLQGYDAVVVGSPIRMDKWLGEAADFVKTHKNELDKLPTAFFTLCLPQLANKTSLEAAYEAYRTNLETLHQPQAQAFFQGNLDRRKLSFMDRMVVKMMKAEDQDRRDWAAIADWAAGLPAELGLS